MGKKIMIGMIGSIALIAGQAFASDCGLVLSGNLNDMVSNFTNTEQYKSYHPFMPPAAFKQAATNLLSYCCKMGLCAENDKKNISQGKYPESPYLFDQIFDITMRRLDGVPKLTYDLAGDPMAVKRRTAMNTTANSANGGQASTIQSTFTGYRTMHEKFTKDIPTVLKNYDTKDTNLLSLADKYGTVCTIINNLYGLLQKQTEVVIGSSKESNSFFSKCEGIVQNRMQRETSYVKLLMIQKSTQLLDETTKAYTKKHFVEEKIMALWALIGKVKDTLQTIVQQAPASKQCSQ